MSFAINWGAGGSSSGSAVTSLSVSLGSGSGAGGAFAAGDIIVIAVSTAASTIPTVTLAGFTAVASGQERYLYRVCTGSGDPAGSSVAVTLSSSALAAAVAFTVTGSSGVDPSWAAWDPSLTSSASLGTSGDIVVSLAAGENLTGTAITLTPPSGYTDSGNDQSSRKSSGGGKGCAAVAAAYATGAQAGSTGSVTWTGSSGSTTILGFSPAIPQLVSYRANSATSISSGFTNLSSQGLGTGSGIVSGDLVLVAVAVSGPGAGGQNTLSVSGAGVSVWNPLTPIAFGGGSGFGTTVTLQVFWGIATASTASNTVTATAGTAGQMDVACASYPGAQSVDFVADSVATASGGVTTLAEPSGTTTATSEMLVDILALWTSSTATLTPANPADAPNLRTSCGSTEYQYLGLSDSGSNVAQGAVGGGSWSWTGAADGGALLVALSSAAGATSVSDTDAGTSTDTGTVQAGSVPISDSDSGSGAESTVYSIRFSSGDAGSAAGAELSYWPTSADAGSGAENTTYPLKLAAADASSTTADGGEAIHASLAATDASSTTVDGGETIRVSSQDAGSGSDLALSNWPASADAGLGAEVTPYAIRLADADSLHGIDAGESVHSPVLDADAAAGSESTAYSVRLSLSYPDTGAFADAELDKWLAGSDSAAGSENTTYTIRLADSDSLHGADAGEGVGAPVSATDAFTGLESTTYSVKMSASDSGSGSDLELSYWPVSADAFTGLESTTYSVKMSASDSGSGSDLELKAWPTGADAGSGTENPSYAVRLTAADSGSGADAELSRWPADFDSGHATSESQIVSGAFSGADGFHGADGGESTHATASDTDTVAGTEYGSLNNPKSDSDFGVFTELGTSVASSADAGSGSDAAIVIALTSSDSAAGADGELNRWLTSSDAGFSADAGSWSGTLALASGEAGSFADAQVLHYTPADTDGFTGAEELAGYDIDIWPVQLLHGPSGWYRVVWHPGQRDEVVIVAAPPHRALRALQHEISQSDSVTMLSDGDTCTGSDAQLATANIITAVLTLGLASDMPGRAGPPGMFGWAGGYAAGLDSYGRSHEG